MIIVTGASGRLGRAVAVALARRGFAEDVVLVTRDPDRVSDLLAQGFRCRQADPSDRGSMRRAFVGAERLFLTSVVGSVPGAAQLHENAIASALDVSTAHLVYESRVHPARESLCPVGRSHAAAEELIVGSGGAFTLLRVNEMAESLDRWLAAAALSGRLVIGGAGPVAYVARRDVVDSVAEVLLGRGHEGRIYELSGPDPLDRVQVARALSDSLGRAVAAPPPAEAALCEELEGLRYQPNVLEVARGMHDASLAGEWAEPSGDPERLTGCVAMPATEYIGRVARAISASPERRRRTTIRPGERTIWDAIGL